MYLYGEQQLIITEDLLINESKKIKKAIKKSRADKGIKRICYSNNEGKEYRSYRLRANAKKFEFEITNEEFYVIINMNCAYCGSDKAGGIDRVNSKIGYTKDNIKPCCRKCNMMKYTHSVNDFLNHVRKINSYQNNAKSSTTN